MNALIPMKNSPIRFAAVLAACWIAGFTSAQTAPEPPAGAGDEPEESPPAATERPSPDVSPTNRPPIVRPTGPRRPTRPNRPPVPGGRPLPPGVSRLPGDQTHEYDEQTKLEQEIREIRLRIQRDQSRLESLLVEKGRLLAPKGPMDVIREERQRHREEIEEHRRKEAEALAKLTPEQREILMRLRNLEIIIRGDQPPLPIELDEDDERLLEKAGFTIPSDADRKAREAGARRPAPPAEEVPMTESAPVPAPGS